MSYLKNESQLIEKVIDLYSEEEKEFDVYYEDENCNTIYRDKRGREWNSIVFLFDISDLQFKKECEHSSIKYIINKHLTDNYQYVELDATYGVDGAAEILGERFEREWGEYLEDYDAYCVFESFSNHHNEGKGLDDQAEFDDLTSEKGWEEW